MAPRQAPRISTGLGWDNHHHPQPASGDRQLGHRRQPHRRTWSNRQEPPRPSASYASSQEIITASLCVWFETWYLAMWCAEVISLPRANDAGPYNNRLDIGGWGADYQLVPCAWSSCGSRTAQVGTGPLAPPLRGQPRTQHARAPFLPAAT